MMKTWLLNEMFRFHRAALTIEGSQGEWGAGDSIAEEDELPPAPANVAASSRVRLPGTIPRRRMSSLKEVSVSGWAILGSVT